MGASDAMLELSDLLPRIDPLARDAVNAFVAARPGARFEVAGLAYALDWEAAPPERLRLAMDLECSAHRLSLALESLDAIDPLLVGHPFDRMPPPLRELLLQQAWASFVAALSGGWA